MCPDSVYRPSKRKQTRYGRWNIQRRKANSKSDLGSLVTIGSLCRISPPLHNPFSLSRNKVLPTLRGKGMLGNAMASSPPTTRIPPPNYHWTAARPGTRLRTDCATLRPSPFRTSRRISSSTVMGARNEDSVPRCTKSTTKGRRDQSCFSPRVCYPMRLIIGQPSWKSPPWFGAYKSSNTTSTPERP